MKTLGVTSSQRSLESANGKVGFKSCLKGTVWDHRYFSDQMTRNFSELSVAIGGPEF